MPIYEYQCKNCGKEFEKLVPMSSDKNPECPQCSSTDVKKKISKTASNLCGCSGCSSSSCSTT
ncbi:MAG TPA: zinc ribbon domain-containing protein [Deltaproteobacteria bacterium]|nr:zinc ribbon domain-containing protein [Deltaproteobacteria bacterium]